MTAEQLEELLVKVTQNKWFRVRQSVYTFDHNKYENDGLVYIAQCETKENATLIALAPYLARRVIAAEKLVEEVSALIERDIAHVGPFAGQRVIAARAALTAYREASK